MTTLASHDTDTFPQIPGYSIVEQIYKGSRTAVYRAVQPTHQRPVVIKVIGREYPSFSELVQFRNQYTIAKNLPIPGIVHPLSLEPMGSGYGLVMEDCGGISLGQYLQQQWLDLAEVLEIALQLSDILQNLCQYRVVHKDIKPANILIHPESKHVKLIDFSIASLLPRETQTIQNPNILEGTLAYLAPEQTGRMNRGIDYRTDFYGLGVTLYQLLTRQLPFQSADPLELVHCHIAKVAMPVDQVNTEVPATVAAIAAKLMAKNAEDRYQSAMGLKHDLLQCLTQWQETGKIDPFELGQCDVSDRFLIPEQLYGREAEVAELLAAFDRISGHIPAHPNSNILRLSASTITLDETTHAEIQTPKSELMLVAGSSGIGKTVVVNEVHKPIVRQRGYFIKGKYDQFQRNIPLSAFVQAFRDLMGQLLAESDTQLQNWKTQILEAVGDNGQVLIDVIPELERIIGKPLPAPELSSNAAQNRFNLLMQKFVQVFTTVNHPLVLFLDDLQWADSASLKLLELLMQDTAYLLVIGAYRDNEVSPAHPAMVMVEEIQRTGARVNTLTLTPLKPSDLNRLVADTLNCDFALAQPLTELVYQKTQGNPFFATQFLKSLHEDGQITFTPPHSSLIQEGRQGGWQCDIAKIRALTVTNDVVEFMALQLQRLPTQTQDVLKLAACIGNQFDLNTLAIVAQRSETDTAIALWEALQEGLILPQSEVYKFFDNRYQPDKYSQSLSIAQTVSSAAQSPAQPVPSVSSVSQSAAQSAAQSVIYRFLHDRVQQAAYSLIPKDRKQATHLKIGQLLLGNVPVAEQAEQIFEIVNHWNLGIQLVTCQEQRSQLAELNLIAGRKALASTAYMAAARYFDAGINLLGSDRWQRQYNLTLSLYESAVEAEYINTHFVQAQTLIDVVLHHTSDLLDRVKVFELQIQLYMAQTEMQKAIQVGISSLKLLGIDLDDELSAQDVQLPTLAEIETLPAMTDAYSLAAMRILMAIMPSVYITQPERVPHVVLTMVLLSLQQGHTAITAYAYAFYGLVLCSLERNIDKGYDTGLLGLKVLERFPARELECRVSNMFSTFVQPWKQPLIDTIAPLTIASQVGFETGDVEYASYTITHSCTHRFLAGISLEEVQKKQAIAIDNLLKIKQDYSIYDAKIWQQVVSNLLGETIHPSQLQGKSFDATEVLPIFCASNNRTLLFTAYVAQEMLNYLFGKYAAAISDAENAANYADAVVGFMSVSIHNFYYSLALLAEFTAGQIQTESDRTTALEQNYQPGLNQVDANQRLMKGWMEHAPENFAHKYSLVEAEKARVLGNKALAIELYDQAIAGAQKNGYLQEEALANELATKFYLDWGKEKIAQDYLTHAYYGYARWSAKAKVQDLECRYAKLLGPILQQQRLSLSATETVFALDSLTSFQTAKTESSSSSSSSISATLDLATVLKASQALSSEIQLDKLLATLLHTVLENAGADKGGLLMPRQDQWFVEAVAMLDQPTRIQSIPIANSPEIPLYLINSVKRSLQPVVIVDASAHPTLATNAYVMQQRPKSMLCTPILQQGKLVAILYLENYLTVGAFTSDRVALLNFLCAQAAISLENARLYQDAQTYAQQLEQSQLQIVQSEKMASLGNLVAGVAHEINNPIGFLNGSIKNADDYVQDLLGHLALYRQHHPNPAPPVQSHAEDIDLEFLSHDLPKLLKSMKGATDRIKGISTSLRTFSRADTDHKVSANLHEGIDSTLLILKYRLKANEYRPAIEVIRDYGNLPQVHCFLGQLNQVFMNILANAIDLFDEMAQTQSVADLQAQPQQITVRTQLVGNHVQIGIRDNGTGMTEAVKAKIFDHLFTTKSVGKGTGLGLAIARQFVVEKHGGNLEVQSEFGQGTEFLIRIPI